MFKKSISLIICLIISLYITSCSQIPINSPCLSKYKSSIDISKYKDVDRFSNAKMFNVSAYIKTEDVNSIAANIKSRLKQFKNLQIDSISQSETSYSLQAYLPIEDAQEVSSVLSDLPGLYSFSNNYSNIGYSYVDSVQRYLGFRSLLDNFDKISEIIKTSNPETDTASLKKMIADQASSYESSINSYEKQVNKCYIQVSVSQK